MPPWKVAIMGLGSIGRGFEAAVDADARFQLMAVADADAERLRRFGDRDSVRGFEDYRSLIVETAHAGLDALLVALPPSQSLEFIPLAADRDVFVVHTPPPARRAEEARRLAAVFEHRRASMFVAGMWPPLSSLATDEEIEAWLGELRAIHILVTTNVSADGWRGDSARAGGGVLLHGTYEAIEWLVGRFGMPESVYASCGLSLAACAPRRYDTEDIAMVTLHFPGGRLGHVTAIRGVPRASWKATLVGTRTSAEVSPKGLAVTTEPIAVETEQTNATDDPIARSLGLLAEAMRSASPTTASQIGDQVGVLAIIEAAYLSARTNGPESPDRFLG